MAGHSVVLLVTEQSPLDTIDFLTYSPCHVRHSFYLRASLKCYEEITIDEKSLLNYHSYSIFHSKLKSELHSVPLLSYQTMCDSDLPCIIYNVCKLTLEVIADHKAPFIQIILVGK